MKEPTCVSVVETTVRAADDFVTAAWLIENTTLTANQISASLAHLKKHTALTCFEADGKLWWYSTPTTDTRTAHKPRRKPEVKPRSPRRTKNGLPRCG